MLLAHSLNWYRFVGRILGKALYQGILVDVGFAGFFLAKVCTPSWWSKWDACGVLTIDVTFVQLVARKAELSRRSGISGPRSLQRVDVPQTLRGESRGSIAELHGRH